MNKIQRRVELADRQVKSQISRMVEMYKEDIGVILGKHFNQIILEISMCFAHWDKITISTLLSSHLYADLQHKITLELRSAAKEIEEYWFNKRRYIELMARAGMTFIDKKTGPPWKKSKLKIKNPVSTEDRFDPRKGHFQLIMSKMAKSIQQQIESGVVKQESGPRIIMRIKKMFDRKKKHGIRERSEFGFYDPDLGPADEFDLQGPVDMQYGFFTPDDLNKLSEEMIESNGQFQRQYRPWFSDEVLANNDQLFRLEQMLYADAVNLVSSGQIDSAPYLKGIKGFIWTVQRPKECDYCDSRDGLTMEEIKEKIHDQYGDTPPGIHPNCRCELVPQMDDDEKDASLENQGVEYDSDTGNLSIPDDVKDKYKLDLSLPEFIQYLKQGGGQ